MEKYALTLLSLVWIAHACGFLLAWVYWLQVKEYRFDRFRSFFNSSESKEELNTGFAAAKYMCLAFSFWVSGAFFVYSLIVGIFVVRIVLLVTRKRLRRPVFTQRAKRILSTPFFLLGILYASTYFLTLDNRFVFMLSEVILLFSPFLGILLTQPIADKVKSNDIKKAQIILKKTKPTVIGVTGSYGKTTTKDFIAEFLSTTYSTKKTLKNFNNEYGVAKSVQSEIQKNTKFFVAEMGAYKMGEIKAITRFAQPSTSLITGIEPQHLDLFGSLENIKKAKFEIVESLPRGGLALFNTTNDECKLLSQMARRLYPFLKIINYQRVKTFPKKLEANTFYVKIDKVSKDIIHFTCKTKNETKKFVTHVAGIHFVENIAGALAVARYYGVAWKSLEKSVEKLKSPHGTMTLSTSQKSNHIIVDDSYNSTPAGFDAALEYISLFKDYKKIVVTKGIIELGSESAKIHKKLSNKIAEIADILVITGSGNNKELVSALGKDQVLYLENLKSVKKLVDKTDGKLVILIEGKVPHSILETIRNL